MKYEARRTKKNGLEETLSWCYGQFPSNVSVLGKSALCSRNKKARSHFYLMVFLSA
jgi:hypothetical protein